MNYYVPERDNADDHDHLHDLIHMLARTVIDNLNEIETDTDLDHIIESSEEFISQEAKLIKEEISAIKQLLESDY